MLHATNIFFAKHCVVALFLASQKPGYVRSPRICLRVGCMLAQESCYQVGCYHGRVFQARIKSAASATSIPRGQKTVAIIEMYEKLAFLDLYKGIPKGRSLAGVREVWSSSSRQLLAQRS